MGIFFVWYLSTYYCIILNHQIPRKYFWFVYFFQNLPPLLKKTKTKKLLSNDKLDLVSLKQFSVGSYWYSLHSEPRCFLPQVQPCSMHTLCWPRRARWPGFGWQLTGTRNSPRLMYLKQTLRSLWMVSCSQRWVTHSLPIEKFKMMVGIWFTLFAAKCWLPAKSQFAGGAEGLLRAPITLEFPTHKCVLTIFCKALTTSQVCQPSGSPLNMGKNHVTFMWQILRWVISRCLCLISGVYCIARSIIGRR